MKTKSHKSNQEQISKYYTKESSMVDSLREVGKEIAKTMFKSNINCGIIFQTLKEFFKQSLQDTHFYENRFMQIAYHTMQEAKKQE
jgi:RNA recognition motif-containing protein